MCQADGEKRLRNAQQRQMKLRGNTFYPTIYNDVSLS